MTEKTMWKSAPPANVNGVNPASFENVKARADALKTQWERKKDHLDAHTWFVARAEVIDAFYRAVKMAAGCQDLYVKRMGYATEQILILTAERHKKGE